MSRYVTAVVPPQVSSSEDRESSVLPRGRGVGGLATPVQADRQASMYCGEPGYEYSSRLPPRATPGPGEFRTPFNSRTGLPPTPGSIINRSDLQEFRTAPSSEVKVRRTNQVCEAVKASQTMVG